jgi:hypothetical protein
MSVWYLSTFPAIYTVSLVFYAWKYKAEIEYRNTRIPEKRYLVT